MKYWQKVKIKSWFYEWVEAVVLDYARILVWWEEIQYDLGNQLQYFSLTSEQKSYKLIDEKRNIILRYKYDTEYFPESILEIIN